MEQSWRTAEPKIVWTVVDGRRMYARVSEGPDQEGHPPVVLVHGLVVSSRYMIPTLERLAPYHRVYAPDLPGFGRSEKPPRALDVPALSDSLAAWMEAVGLERAAFVGNSMGCQVIADLAVRHPKRVEKAVLQGPTMEPRGRTIPRQVARFLLGVVREPLSLGPIMLLDYLQAGFVRGLLTLRHALEDRIEEKLPRVRVPVLVVRGSRDPIVPQRWAEEAARLLPQGQLIVVPGAAHTMNFDAPAELTRVVRRFLNDRPRTAERQDE